MAQAIGIDVHDAYLTIAQHDGAGWTTPRTVPALRRLAARLVALAPPVVVLEPSGGYEQAVLDALHVHDVPVARVSTRQVRAWIRGIGIQAKSDRLDARMLARYGAETRPRLTPAPTPTQRRVARLSALRRTLRDDISAKTCQCAEQPLEVQIVYRRVIAALQVELDVVTTTIAELVATAPEWARTRGILRSCPGIGAHSEALLLAELTELGQVDGKQIASLVGVAPYTKQSGATRGTAHISGGRSQVRAGLWMPTRTAMRYNPTIAAFARRLRAAGKPETVVTVACLRKLVTILNAMVRDDREWQTPALTA